MELVEKSGAWYSFEGERIGQGRENVKKFLAENTDILDRIAELVREKAGLGKAKTAEEEADQE
jgi:recombination protein RecA